MNPFHNNRPPPPPPPPPPPHHIPPFLHPFPPPPPVPIETHKVTLFVKNLPNISKEEINHYFMTLGALGVRLMDSKKMKNSGFIDFQNYQLAQNTIQYLNNNLWFGQRVKASISKSSTNQNSNNCNNSESSCVEQYKLLQVDKNKSKLNVSDDLAKFEPISTKLGINYPSNPELKYKYPDPTHQTLANITKAIASVPNLYIQVLHLMNKMNLPPPFEGEFPESSNVNIQDIQIPETIAKVNNDNNYKVPSSEEESEIEVDDEDDEAATKVPPPKRIKSWAPERNSNF